MGYRALLKQTMKHILLILTAMTIIVSSMSAQGQLADQQPGTLFAYPLAPDTCSSLEERCNYIINHFWENYDISRPVADEAAFERTFRDYVDFFKYAHRNVAIASVRDLVNKAQSNTSTLQKLGEVAERVLYGPEAEFWSDEVYVPFAMALASDKRLPKELREHYGRQLARINAVQLGSVLDFEYTGLDGERHRVSDLEAKTLVILFVDEGVDSSIGRVRMSSDVSLNSLIDAGELTLVCLSLNAYSADWARVAAGYGANWVVGCGADLASSLDLRILPCCYVLDSDHVVLNKTQSVEGVLSAVNPVY